MQKKCRSAANLQHNSCVKFANKFSIGLEIAISHENLGEADNFLSYGGLGKFCYTGGLNPKGYLENLGAETPLETMPSNLNMQAYKNFNLLIKSSGLKSWTE